MANLRNEFEFRSGLLDALGVEHTEADAKNEERWRSKMLDGLGVEYNQNDVNQFDLFRAKLLEGVESMSEGGGGSSDFSTAEVTIEGETQDVPGLEISSGIAFIEDDEIVCVGNFIDTGTYTVVLYKGTQVLYSRDEPTATSGNVAVEVAGKDYAITISGSCVITAPYIL